MGSTKSREEELFNRFRRGALACSLLGSSVIAMATTASTVTPPNLSGGLAGTIPGQAGVSSRGASQYSFSIPVPPGTAGMAPSLGMSYDSENPWIFCVPGHEVGLDAVLAAFDLWSGP